MLSAGVQFSAGHQAVGRGAQQADVEDPVDIDISSITTSYEYLYAIDTLLSSQAPMTMYAPLEV